MFEKDKNNFEDDFGDINGDFNSGWEVLETEATDQVTEEELDELVKNASVQSANNSAKNKSNKEEAVKETKTKKALKKQQVEEDEDFDAFLNDNSDLDNESENNYDDDEPEYDADTDEGREEDDEAEAEDVEQESEESDGQLDEEQEDEAEDAEDGVRGQSQKDVKKSRIPKRIEGLITKLKEKDAILAEKQFQYAEVIRNLIEENEKLKATSITIAKAEAEAKYKQAKEKLKQANDMGDTDAVVEATEELADAKIALSKVAEPAQKANEVPKITLEQSLGQIKAKAWIDSNPVVLQNPSLKSLAARINNQLLSEDFADYSDEFYVEISKRMNAELAKAGVKTRIKVPYGDFMAIEEDVTEVEAPKSVKKKVPEKKVQGGVPSRTKAAGVPQKAKSIRLDKDYELAKKYGTPKEHYLKQKALLAKRSPDSNGYIPVYIPE